MAALHGLRPRAQRNCYNQSMNEYRIYPGMSTRGAQVASGEQVRFSRETLDSVAQQVGSGFVPMGTEHLTYLPPRGRLTRAEVVTDEAGESELVLYGKDLPVHAAGSLSLDPAPVRGEEPTEIVHDFTLGAEPRNYTPDAWQELLTGAPTEITEQVAWSELPPLIWTIYLAVSWGAIKFAGSFLSQLGTKAADGLVSWLRRAGRTAKDADRETLVEVHFHVPDGGARIYGFVPFDARSDASAVNLQTALDMAGLLAEFAGSVAAGQQPAELRQCSFQWDSDRWRLGWWATDEAVYVTPWFRENYPDPKRFLGRPSLQPDSEGEGQLNQPDTE
jgi:hypothetical protein